MASLTIKGTTYQGFESSTFNNWIFCKDKDGNYITDADDYDESTAKRYLKVVIDGTYDAEKNKWYYTSYGETPAYTAQNCTAYLAYYQDEEEEGRTHPFALVSDNSPASKKDHDLGWVTREFFEYYFVPDKIIVTLDPNGGTLSATDKTTLEINPSGTYGALPEPTINKKGYYFGGWYTAKTGGTLVDSNSSVAKSTNHTLYAHWDEYTIKIKYYKNGADSATYQGTNITSSTPLLTHTIKYTETDNLYNYNNPSGLNITKYRHIAYPKAEWNTKKDGSGTSSSQTESMTGENWAKRFGKSIDDKHVDQNVYVNWIPDGLIRIYVKDQGWKLGVPYIYVKNTGWKETYAYVYDSKFGTTDGWKPGR